ncbi:MAG: sulfotransferase family 2 domain-containing protein [Paracoccus sp. (in: a-proteobacteria)]|uniref:sulfotransferase family 2 domain-containing protein n=1 Tax=Paracoccus sp. TaxID=267 RepID=UPI0039E53C83
MPLTSRSAHPSHDRGPARDHSHGVVYDNRTARRAGQLHLTLSLGGKRIRYAYIRKNGCSCFKAALGYHPATKITEIARRHRSRWFYRHDATIFVWRDPEERLISLYRNKIIDGRNNEDLLQRYRAAMGEEPSSFERFAEFAELAADPHCLPQADHLHPIIYTHAIPLRRLHDWIQRIVGPRAAQPFARRVNDSASAPVEVTARARSLIRSVYAADYRMIERLT